MVPGRVSERARRSRTVMSPIPSAEEIARPRRTTGSRFGDIPRLGLASRGNTGLSAAGVRRAIAAGVRYLNWCGEPDGMSEAIRGLSASERERVVVAVQLEARHRSTARDELEALQRELGTARIDVATYYWVESEEEWDEIQSGEGAARAVSEAIARGTLCTWGITTHQRLLAAKLCEPGTRREPDVPLVMIRYNAAHTGAEEDVFPAARRAGVPVVAYTALRWGALLRPTPEDPPDFRLPTAPECYRFSLAHPDVTICLFAPNEERELEEDLALLEDEGGFGLALERYEEIRQHGIRVRRHAGSFP